MSFRQTFVPSAPGFVIVLKEHCKGAQEANAEFREKVKYLTPLH